MSKTNNTAKALTELEQTLQLFQKQVGGIIKNIEPIEQLVEEVKPYYLNPAFESSIKIPTVYRFNQHNNRHYFTVASRNTEEQELKALDLIKFFPSVTNIIDKTMPTSFGKLKILGELGLKGYYKMLREKGFYGTFLHILISDYLRSANNRGERWFEFDTIPGRVSLFIEEKNIDFDTNNWVWQAKRDLASLIQFCIDYEVEPISVEIIGTYDDGKIRFAGTLDLLCEMTIKEKGFFGEVYKSGDNKGKEKESTKERRVIALIDFKSGQSGFFTDYEVQLHMYRLIAEQSLGIKVEKLYNLAPYDWETSPTYSLKDQTDSIWSQCIPFILGIYQINWKDPKDILIISGKVNGGQSMNEVCKWVPAADYVFNQVQRQYEI